MHAFAYADTRTHVTTYEYDATTGLVTAVVQNPDDPQLNRRTAFTYDSFGNKLTTTVSSTATGSAAIPTRTTETVTYDSYGIAPASYKNALGQVATTQFDPSNLPVYVADLNGLHSTWVYDGFGRVTKETRPDGNISTWTYSLCSQTPCSIGTAAYAVVKRAFASNGTTANGPTVSTYYDSLNRVVRTETTGFDGTSLITEDTEYDNLGHVARKSRPYYPGQTVKWTSFTYDVLGRVTDLTNPDGSHVHTDYNGLTTTVTNPLGQTRTTTVDSQGRTVQVVDAANGTLQFQYDADGNLIKTTDPKGNTVSMTYDAAGRKVAMTDPDMGTSTYVYDALGQLQQQTDAKGQSVSLQYDLLGRVIKRTEPDLVSTWTFDSCTMGKGQLCKSTADNGYTSTPTYDSLGRLASTATTIDTAYNTSVTFDANGRVATQVYPTGLTVKYVYTALGYLKEVRDNASNALYWQANAMDAEGHLTQQTYGNNLVTTQVFDPNTGRMLATRAGTNNAVQNLSFTYDARGNLLTRADSNQSLSESFLYDNLNRLTSNTVNSGGAGVVTQTYAYDSIGNITSRGEVGTYTYGAVNVQPHAVGLITRADGGTRQYTYDANGNLTQEVERDAAGNVVAAKGRTVSYTSFNMPLTIATPTASLTYVYGPDHQRIKETGNGVTTIYLNPDSAGGLLYEKDMKSDGSIEHRHFITAGGVVALIKQDKSGNRTVLYMHRDYLGSTTAVSDANGNVMERMAYEPFGKRRTPAGALDPSGALKGNMTDRGFTNHEELDSVGLINMNGRVFDPVTGRFITADPTVAHPSNTQGYNRYSYVYNNPLISIDPTGFFEKAPGGGGGGFWDDLMGGISDFFGWGDGYDAAPYSGTASEVSETLGGGGATENGIASVPVTGHRATSCMDTGSCYVTPGGAPDTSRPDNCQFLGCINQSTGNATPVRSNTGDPAQDYVNNLYSQTAVTILNAGHRFASWWITLTELGLAGAGEEGGPRTLIAVGKKWTRRSANQWDVYLTQAQAIRNLTLSGFKKSLSKDGTVTIMSFENKVYRFYELSTGGGMRGGVSEIPSASVEIDGTVITKLRFRGR